MAATSDDPVDDLRPAGPSGRSDLPKPSAATEFHELPEEETDGDEARDEETGAEDESPTGIDVGAALYRYWKRWSQDAGGLGVSLLLHGCLFLMLAASQMAIQQEERQILVESLISDEERKPEEFTRELDTQQEIAQTINFVAGGIVSDQAAGSTGGSAGQQQAKIEASTQLSEPKVEVSTGAISTPGLAELGNDLGMEQVIGEGAALVEGYGPALDQFTQELIRLMREQRVLVVWLFDESESMKDDQAELKTRIGRIYEELKLVEKDAQEEILLTSVMSFGEKVNFQLNKRRPTKDRAAIIKAIDQVPIDRTGTENTCQAIATAINEYRKFAGAGRRKIVLAVVSDESGDDGDSPYFEEALQLAKSTRTSIYFFGRESAFGYPYIFVNWTHPQTEQHHYLPVTRGPETPYAELLQFDGFRVRRDASMSGFGPYLQVRLARNTGGVFYLLPGEQQNINDFRDQKFAHLDLKEYEPDLRSRREYALDRDRQDFRKAIWDAITILNPYDSKNKDLDVDPGAWFVRDSAAAGPAVTAQIRRAERVFAAVNLAWKRIESVQDLRSSEKSRRWRANYDLARAQLMSYRVRIYQYMIALEQFSRQLDEKDRFKDAKSNQWAVYAGANKLLAPTKEQVKTHQVTLEEMEAARKAVIEQFSQVEKEHPGTPWAARAAWEKTRGMGASFGERYWTPPKPVQFKGEPVPVPRL